MYKGLGDYLKAVHHQMAAACIKDADCPNTANFVNAPNGLCIADFLISRLDIGIFRGPCAVALDLTWVNSTRAETVHHVSASA